MKSLFILIFLLPIASLGQALTEPQTLSQAVSLIPIIHQAFDSKDYAVLVCAVLMLITFGIKNWVLPKDGSKDHILPAVSSTTGALLGGVVSSMVPGADVLSSVIGGGVLGNAASGLYDMIIKPIKKKKTSESK